MKGIKFDMCSTYSIICLVNDFIAALSKTKQYSKEYDEVEEKYAQALRIQCNSDYGHIMIKEDFINCVKSGEFTDYDGHGYYLDFEGNRIKPLDCNVKNLTKNDYPFIDWYNK